MHTCTILSASNSAKCFAQYTHRLGQVCNNEHIKYIHHFNGYTVGNLSWMVTPRLVVLWSLFLIISLRLANIHYILQILQYRVTKWYKCLQAKCMQFLHDCMMPSTHCQNLNLTNHYLKHPHSIHAMLPLSFHTLHFPIYAVADPATAGLGGPLPIDPNRAGRGCAVCIRPWGKFSFQSLTFGHFFV